MPTSIFLSQKKKHQNYEQNNLVLKKKMVYRWYRETCNMPYISYKMFYVSECMLQSNSFT